MKVLSLFDGISCTRVALERANIPIEAYYASEIDKYAMQISAKNYPDIIQVGSVAGLDTTQFKDIGLLIGGSPCQDLSIAKKDRKGLAGDRSGLFWKYVRILKEVKPKYFILENVNSMPKEAKQVITEALGVEPIMIDAALVSAQRRKRLFWTNIPNIIQPKDRNIVLKDVLGKEVEEKYFTTMDFTKRFDYTIHEAPYIKKAQSLRATDYKGTHNCIRIGQIGKGGQGDRIYSIEGKSIALAALAGGRGAKTGLYKDGIKIRRLTPLECERLQSLPDFFTDGVSNTQRYKMLGNAFNVDVVAHILSFI